MASAMLFAVAFLGSMCAIVNAKGIGPITHAMVVVDDHAKTCGSSGRPALQAKSFATSSVKLDPQGLYGVAQARNLAFVTSLNLTELTCIFTAAANLTKCDARNCPSPGLEGKPICTPVAGEMSLGGYYGHYLGHWLSATAYLINNTGDARVKQAAEEVVNTLSSCQAAWAVRYGPDEGKGYLFPYDIEAYRKLETPPYTSRPIYSVPFYTLHKLLAGMLDQWQMANNEVAHQAALELGDWVVRNVNHTMAREGIAGWQDVLGTEWGGMNEVMFNLYKVTGKQEYLNTGYAFNHWSWSAPLAAGQDDLPGNHANTHIPEVIGNAVGFELTGNKTDEAIVLEFFKAVTENHSFATGGSNDGEHWGAAHRLGDELNANTEESCTQYNILKVARHLYEWTANSSFFDFYENGILNGILGNQNHLASDMTKFIYMLPVGGAGMHKPWGWSNQSIPCCWGTLSEQFSKMSDSIYFKSPADDVIFVNQFVSSTVNWDSQNVIISQVAGFPHSSQSTTVIKVEKANGNVFGIKIRVPQWAHGANSVKVNSVAVSNITPGTYLDIHREWNTGDEVSVDFPMGFWISHLNDDRVQFNGTFAFMYGPLVLAGYTGTNRFIPNGEVAKPSQWMRRTSPDKLTFTAHGTDSWSGSPTELDLVALFEVMDETYTVYFDTNKPPTVPYSPAGATVPSASAADLVATGSASITNGPHDDATSGKMNIRSGNPGQIGRIMLRSALVASGHVIDKISLSFRYVAGYTPAPGQTKSPSTVDVVLVNASSQTQVLRTLLKTGPLGSYSWDHFTGYSPPIVVNASGLNLNNDGAVLLGLQVHNNDRNVQIPVDDLAGGFNANVEWTSHVESLIV